MHRDGAGNMAGMGACGEVRVRGSRAQQKTFLAQIDAENRLECHSDGGRLIAIAIAIAAKILAGTRPGQPPQHGHLKERQAIGKETLNARQHKRAISSTSSRRHT